MATKKKTAVYNFTLDQIHAMKEQAISEAAGVALELTLGLPVIALHDKWGFGRKRLERFTEQVMKLHEEYGEGRITLDDVRKALYDETGLQIRRKK